MIRPLTCLALALLLSLPGGLASAQKATQKSTSSTTKSAGQTKEDLAKVRDRIRNLEKDTRQDRARRGELDKQLREAETAASRTRQALNATRRELAEAQRQLAELNRQVAATRDSLERQRAALAGQLRLAHMTGGSERVRAFFNQEDPAEIGRRLTWLAYLAQSRESCSVPSRPASRLSSGTCRR